MPSLAALYCTDAGIECYIQQHTAFDVLSMNMSLFTLLKLCVLLNLVSQIDTLRVGSWSFSSFGKTKLENVEAMTTILQIMRRYDVIFMQGIKDASQDVLHELRNRLNTSNQLWNYTASARLGDSANKLQYAYYYRMENLTLLDSYQFDDVNNTFEWEPFGALFNSSETGDLKRVGLLGVKIYRPDITSEITALASVVEDAKKTWNIQNILLMGDLKHCGYLTNKDFSNVTLVSDKSYNWLINDSFDTTSSNTSSCPADRMIANGVLLNQRINESSVQAFRFDEYYHLNSTQTKDISPRYPVEVIIMKSPQQNTKGMSDASVDNEGTTTKSGGAKVWFSKLSLLAIVVLLKMV